MPHTELDQHGRFRGLVSPYFRAIGHIEVKRLAAPIWPINMKELPGTYANFVRSVERRQFAGTFLFGNRPQFELMRRLSARKPDPSVRDHPVLLAGFGVANKTRAAWKVRIRLPVGRG